MGIIELSIVSLTLFGVLLVPTLVVAIAGILLVMWRKKSASDSEGANVPHSFSRDDE